MTISIFDLFSIGIGPSSSHTVGPMKAAYSFAQELEQQSHINPCAQISVELFGSLAYTGKGHGTHDAILMGLEGNLPDTIDPKSIQPRIQQIYDDKVLSLNGTKPITFISDDFFIMQYKAQLPAHTNGMRFTATSDDQQVLLSTCYYSIGGGFIVDDQQTPTQNLQENLKQPYPFTTGKELIELCEKHQLTIAEIMLANESVWQNKEKIIAQLLQIDQTMEECIHNGCHSEGILPGGLDVRRRAPNHYRQLISRTRDKTHEHTDSMSWLNLYALAVNEENASGGRVVTAPTNGAAGIIPAVLNYYKNFFPQACQQDTIDFLLTAGAIALLYKKNASISGAEVGCQGEVGVAASMAAGALTAVLNGTVYQIENAAEIAMEHHLGMTCDPINGLVQIPCIERNAMGANKAVNAARLAMMEEGQHHISLDKVIATMKQTGKDMMTIYKETSQGGLAANLPEC